MFNRKRKFENPAELALSKADIVTHDYGNQRLESTPAEEAALIELDVASQDLDFFGSYFVESSQAFAIPAAYEINQPVSIINFGSGISFQGSLETHSVVKINSLHVSWAEKINIRSLCLTFDDVLMLPYFEPLEASRLLFVPAQSVNSMSRL